MKHKTTIAMAVLAAALALPIAAHAQQQQDTAAHKPITPKTVAQNTGKETVRVAKRTSKATSKGATDTGKQAKRAARGVKKVYSRKARQEANGEKAKKDSVKAATQH